MVAQEKVSTWLILKTIDFRGNFPNRIILILKGTHNCGELSGPTSSSGQAYDPLQDSLDRDTNIFLFYLI
jgi:hypothetical protein